MHRLPESIAPVEHARAVGDQWLLLQAGQSGGSTLVAYDPATKRGRWQVRLASAPKWIRVTDSLVLVLTDDLEAYDWQTGARSWHYPLGGQRLLHIGDKSAVVAGFEPHFAQIMLVDLDSGRPRWPSWSPTAAVSGAELVGPVVYVASSGGPFALRATTGRRLEAAEATPPADWSAPIRPAPHAEWVDDAAASSDWRVRSRGDQRWLVGPLSAGPWPLERPPLQVASCGAAFCAMTESALVRLEVELTDDVVERCRSAIQSGADSGCVQQLFDFAELVPGGRDASRRMGLALLRGLREGSFHDTRWLAPWLAQVQQAPLTERKTVAHQVASAALALRDAGQLTGATELLRELSEAGLAKDYRGLVFGIGLQRARALADEGKSAMARRDSAEAERILESLVGIEGVAAILPASIADAGDGRRQLAKAFKDVDVALTEGLGGKHSNQPLCVARCELERAECHAQSHCEAQRQQCLGHCTEGRK